MHVEKFKACGVGMVLAHIERALTKEGLHRNYGNENVDTNKSGENYRLDGSKSPHKKYANILQRDNVKMQKRDDVNTLCSVCLTLPADVRPEDEKKFFAGAFDFLQKRYAPYGNVVIAEVHKDETKGENPGRPHLHFCFVPLALDVRHKEKKGAIRYKVSAKEIINKADLKTLHNDCADHMAGVLGYRCGILLDDEKQKESNNPLENLKRLLNSKLVKNLPAAQYKEAMDLLTRAIAIIDDAQKSYDKNIDAYNDIVDEYNKLIDECKNIDDEIIALQRKKAKLLKDMRTLEGEDFTPIFYKNDFER